MAAHRNIALGAVLLAAGRSTRMGRPKLLLPWAGTTVLGHLIATWSKVPSAQIAVVCAGDDGTVSAELDRLAFPAANRIFNPDPDRGMFSSIQCAAQWAGWTSELTHWTVVLGDQPHLQPATLAALRDFAAQFPEAICQPSRHGRARHPVILPEPMFRQLAATRAANLKEFLQSFPGAMKLVEIDDPGLDLDLDRPEDYKQALSLAFGGG